MQAPSILAIIAIIIFDILSVWGIFEVWRRRKNSYVRSRGPIPAIISGVMSMMIVTNIFIQEIYRREGLEFVCPINLFHSWITVPLCAIGFVYRGLRVVILSTPEMRKNLGWMLGLKGMAVFYAQNLLPCVIGLIIVMSTTHLYHTHGHEGCYCFIHQEIKFWLGFMVLVVGALSMLSKKLREFGDKVNLAQELILAFITIFTMVPTYLILIAWHEWKGLAIRPNVQFIIVTLHTILQLNTFAPMRWKSKKKAGANKVHVGSDNPAGVVTTADFQSVQQIMPNKEMWIAFGETVEKFLCGESYWFLDEVHEYELMVGEPASARFQKVQDIREKYIKQGSNFEINIETKMRNNAMQVSTLEAFEKLSEEGSQNIFSSAAQEIRKMLGENVIVAFHKSPQFMDICARRDCEKDDSIGGTFCTANSAEISVANIGLPEIPSVAA